MTVGELIDKLQSFDDDLEVKVADGFNHIFLTLEEADVVLVDDEIISKTPFVEICGASLERSEDENESWIF